MSTHIVIPSGARNLLLLLALLLAVPPAHANPLLLIPTGTTLTTGQFRLEAALSPDNENGKYFWLTTGFMQLEGSMIRRERPGSDPENMFAAQWCFLPETFITPAVSFGMWDIASQSKEGIAGYLAVTKSIPIPEGVPVVREFSATVGLGVAGLPGPFAGFDAKLPAGFFLQGEYDTKTINGAVGWQPIPMFRLKAYSIRHDFYFGAELLPVIF